MARKKANGDGEQSPGPGHNLEQLTDDQRHALTAQHATKYEAGLKAKKAADADFKNVCKVARADLGDTAIDDIKDLIAGSTPEGEKALKARLQAEEERQQRIARWLGLTAGTQSSMFDEEDRTPSSDRAFADGKRIGLAGGNFSTSHAPGTEQYNRALEGYHEGQAVLAAGFKKPTQPADDERDLRPSNLRNDAGRGDAIGDAPATFTTQ